MCGNNHCLRKIELDRVPCILCQGVSNDRVSNFHFLCVLHAISSPAHALSSFWIEVVIKPGRQTTTTLLFMTCWGCGQIWTIATTTISEVVIKSRLHTKSTFLLMTCWGCDHVSLDDTPRALFSWWQVEVVIKSRRHTKSTFVFDMLRLWSCKFGRHTKSTFLLMTCWGCDQV